MNALNVQLRAGKKRWVHFVQDVNLAVYKGHGLGLLGESGSGKTLTCQVILGLTTGNPMLRVSGNISFGEQTVRSGKDLLGRPPWGGGCTLVPQDAAHGLNPFFTVGATMRHVLAQNHGLPEAAAEQEALALLSRLNIDAPHRTLRQRPHELSVGQRQRVLVAAALACDPDVLVADEPTSALDTVSREHVLRELSEYKRGGGTLVVTSHEPRTLAELCDDIAVMYCGRIVEHGPASQVLAVPLHPYTQALLSCLPRPDTDPRLPLPEIPGEPPSIDAIPSGCRFHPRCPRSKTICEEQPPPLVDVEPDREVACILFDGRDPA